MRLWLYLFLFAVVVVGGIVAAQLYLNEPVYVEYGQWSMEPNLSVALAFLFLAILLLYALMRFLWFCLLLPKHIGNWRQQHKGKKRRQLLADVVRLLATRDRRESLKSLSVLATTDAAAAWLAAKTAAELGNDKMQDKWLQEAAAGDDAIIAAAANAEICMRNNRPTEAANVLKAAGAPRASTLLAESSFDVSKMSGDWAAALMAAVCLRENAPKQWAGAVNEAITQFLQKAAAAESVKAFWKDDVPADDRKNPQLVAAYLSALMRLGNEKTAQDELNQALKQHPQHNDILEVVVSVGTNEQCQLALKANEGRANNKDTAVLRLLAELAQRLNLPGKARQYYQMLNTLSPHPRYQNILATLAKE